MKRTELFTSIFIRSSLVLCLFFCCIHAYAQKNKKHISSKQQPIQIHHANSLEFDQKLGAGAERLVGNVELEDDSVVMDCDSAYVYPDNSFRAFSNVHLSRKDTMNLYGDSLHYHSDTKQAEMFGKIRYLYKTMTLNTEHLIYDINAATVHYWNGGTLVDSANTLVSRQGTYNMRSRMYSFKDTVVLTNPNYTVRCDTMNYDPNQQTAYFTGPTHITSKDNYMYCIAGYYNTHTGVSQFWNHAYITGKKGERLSGEQIYYDKSKDSGKVVNDVELSDTSDHILIKGNYAIYTGSKKTIMVTGHALMDQVSEKDTLHLHGDTLYGYNISMADSGKGKSKPKLLLAYHHVKFYKKDLQGKCDSMSYDEKDSVMRMFYSPILWSNQNQLTSDTMRLYMENHKIKTLDMLNNSFIVSRDTLASKDDSLQFNQIKGRNIKGFFKDNKIYKVKVMGNAQTVYYVYSDNNTTMVGVNRAACSNMLVLIDSNKIHSLTFLQKPDATLFPMKDVKPADFLLGNFSWRIKERPLTEEDIFKKEQP